MASSSSTIDFDCLTRLDDNKVRYSVSAPAASPRPSRPLLTYPSMEHKVEIESTNEQISPLPEVGCLIGQFSIYGAGHTLHDGLLITQPVELHTVAEQWHQDTALSISHRVVEYVNEPAITIVGPGHKIYGHWLVDILPRLHIARATLGPKFVERIILLPNDTPTWAVTLMLHLFGSRLRFKFYDIACDILYGRDVCVPSFGQSKNVHFHPIIEDLYGLFRGRLPGTKKLCVSRKNVEGISSGMVKRFPQRTVFEDIALLHGYEIVFPEAMSIASQIDMMRSARVIVGEYGSALHGSFFASPGTIVGATGPFNQTQMRICAFSEQTSIFLSPPTWSIVDGVLDYSCSIPHIAEFFDVIDTAVI